MSPPETLGINTVHIDVEDLPGWKIQRVELCLGRGTSYRQMWEKMERERAFCQERGWPFSIHLPLILKDYYPHDYLSAFFLDPDPRKRALSFRFLKDNLEALAPLGPDYFVLHFPGVYHDKGFGREDFIPVLEEALTRIDALARDTGVRVLLEYFGSNSLFFEPSEWVERLETREHLGLLVDTGHLYFASLLRKFSFEKALGTLAQAADAFHLWTTRGNTIYGNNPAYKAYHHIVPHIDQRKDQGFAFDTRPVLDLIASMKKPLILEASPYYGGRSYYEAGVQSVIDHLSK